MSKKSRPKKIAERGSVRFHRIGKTTFWLTPTNRVFLIAPKDLVIFPRLQAGIVNFDDPHYEPSEKIRDWLFQVLDTQRGIRTDWALTEEEDENAFRYSS